METDPYLNSFSLSLLLDKAEIFHYNHETFEFFF